MTDITKWRAGDRAYLSAETRDSPLHRGDIVRVTGVMDGNPVLKTGLLLFPRYKPLRILQPNEVIPAGSHYMRINPHGNPTQFMATDAMQVWDTTLCAIVSVPDPSAGVLQRIEAAEAELKKAREELRELSRATLVTTSSGCAVNSVTP